MGSNLGAVESSDAFLIEAFVFGIAAKPGGDFFGRQWVWLQIDMRHDATVRKAVTRRQDS